MAKGRPEPAPADFAGWPRLTRLGWRGKNTVCALRRVHTINCYIFRFGIEYVEGRKLGPKSEILGKGHGVLFRARRGQKNINFRSHRPGFRSGRHGFFLLPGMGALVRPGLCGRRGTPGPGRRDAGAPAPGRSLPPLDTVSGAGIGRPF